MTSFLSTGRSTRAAAALVMLACGGDNDDGPTGNPGTIQIAVSPTAISIPTGGSGSVVVTLTRAAGFTGVVALTVAGLPTGATVTLDPPQLLGTALSATVTVSVALTVTPGTYTATVTAAAEKLRASADFVLTVTAAPNYAISVTPGALTIAAGSSGTTTVNIDRTNFTGGVTLEIVSPPAGVTGVFSPSPSTSNTSTLTLTAGANVAPGNYPLTIKGTATGISDRSAPLQLTVIAAPTAGKNVEYLFCDPSLAPVFFAYQDGTGPWQAVSGTTAGGATRFALNLTSGRGGVLMVDRSTIDDSPANRSGSRMRSARIASPRTRLGTRSLARTAAGASRMATLVDVYVTQVLYASTAELAEDGTLTCAQTLPSKTIKGTVAGVAVGQYGILSLGSSTEIFNGAAPANPVTFSDVQGGLVDFAGTRVVTPGSAPDRAVMFRDLNIPDGGSLPSTIDFNGPAAFVPATATVTITGASGDRLEVYNQLITATSLMLFWNDLSPSTASTRPWAGLGVLKMRTGDFHSLIVFASPPNSPDDFRVALKYLGPVSNQTIALGPTIDAATVSPVVAGAYPRYRFQGTLPAEYNKGIGLDVSAEDIGNVFNAIATSAYLAAAGSASSYDITMPDVSALAGFPLASRLTAGINLVTTDAFGFTGAGIFDARPVLGGEFRASDRRSTVTVP